MIIYVFRHGQTEESKADINYSPERRINADILPETFPVIEKLATYLKTLPTQKNITSPIKRCLQTVDIVKEISQKEFEIDEDLTEWMEPDETFPDLVSRVKKIYIKIANSEYENVLVCTHGGLIAGLKSVCESGDFTIERLHDYPMPGVLLMIDTATKKVNLIDFN